MARWVYIYGFRIVWCMYGVFIILYRIIPCHACIWVCMYVGRVFLISRLSNHVCVSVCVLSVVLAAGLVSLGIVAGMDGVVWPYSG